MSQQVKQWKMNLSLQGISNASANIETQSIPALLVYMFEYNQHEWKNTGMLCFCFCMHKTIADVVFTCCIYSSCNKHVSFIFERGFY